MTNEKLIGKYADLMYVKWTAAVCMMDALENYRQGNIEESWFDLFCWAEAMQDESDIFYTFTYSEYAKAISLLRDKT